MSMPTPFLSNYLVDRTGIWTSAKKKRAETKKNPASVKTKPMQKTYALKRLLEHGPMTPKEITDCTRWTSKTVHRTLDLLLEQELINSTGNAYEAAK